MLFRAKASPNVLVPPRQRSRMTGMDPAYTPRERAGKTHFIPQSENCPRWEEPIVEKDGVLHESSKTTRNRPKRRLPPAQRIFGYGAFVIKYNPTMSFNNSNAGNSSSNIRNDDDVQRRPEIVEDLPAMRSVMIGGAIPAMPLRRTLHHDPLLAGPKLPPPATRLVPTPVKVVASSASPSSSAGATAAAAAATTADSSCRWQVTTALPVPSYYDLERTHTRVKGVSALEVSQRVDECLRAESIAASFDNEQAVVRAVCAQCVKFVVRLWDCQGDIVVEIQRSSGCSFLYQQIAKKILEAADPSRRVAKQGGLRAPPPLPRSLPPIPDVEWEANTCEGIEHAINAFKMDGGKRLDAHLLAIESLVYLSEGCKCKRACAEAVLQADGPILPHVVSLVQLAPGDMNSYTDETEALMHRHAVNLLANCLETIQSASGDIASTLENLPELVSDAMLHALLREMDVNRPHDAAAACRCLTALLSGGRSSNLKDRVLRMGANDAATAVSRCRHALLEKESAKLQQFLLL